jgi:large subunit ribosomal protein L23
MNVHDIIIKPVFTEKASLLREKTKKVYVFKVARQANKLEVMKAVKEIFAVEPISCTIVNVRGKRRANIPYKGSVKRGFGATAAWKKAYVTLPEGKTIAELEA